MKNILVPTDFSDNANNALQYAIHLANQFGSKIHLIHSFMSPRTTGSMVSMRGILKKDADDQLSQIVKDNKDRFLNESSLSTEAAEGYMESVITGYAKSVSADLIIMGTQGASKLKGVFIGSNTTAVIKKSKVSVLAIPSEYTYQPLKDIVFAVDNQDVKDKAVLSPLLSLAKEYKAHVSVLHVEKEKVPAGIVEEVNPYLSEVAHSFNTIYNDNIKNGIDEFVTKIDANLLCMIHRDRGMWGNLLHKSVVKTEAFDSSIPLLVLFDKH